MILTSTIGWLGEVSKGAAVRGFRSIKERCFCRITGRRTGLIRSMAIIALLMLTSMVPIVITHEPSPKVKRGRPFWILGVETFWEL